MTGGEASKLAELLALFEVAHLTTIDERYQLVSRPMLPLYNEFDGRLWFFAHRNSRVVSHVSHRASTNVTFASPKAWISLAGTADICHDLELAEGLWSTDLAPWFPDGLDPGASSLVEFTADEARYWHSPSAMETLVHLVAPRLRPTVTRPRSAGISLY